MNRATDVSAAGAPQTDPCVRCGPKECPSPHGLANKLARVAWGAAWLFLFRPTPKVLHPWRRILLRAFGGTVSRSAKIFPSVRVWAPWNLKMDEFAVLSAEVDCYCVAPVAIGAHATVSQGALLCTATHDVTDPHMRLLTAPIVIEDQAWVCARAYVAPGVSIGRGAVVGAMAVATRDVPPWTIVAGNPAREIGRRQLRQGPPQK
jgi:putative colanic acid biosynthesis acetyltransferase WcaF